MPEFHYEEELFEALDTIVGPPKDLRNELEYLGYLASIQTKIRREVFLGANIGDATVRDLVAAYAVSRLHDQIFNLPENELITVVVLECGPVPERPSAKAPYARSVFGALIKHLRHDYASDTRTFVKRAVVRLRDKIVGMS